MNRMGKMKAVATIGIFFLCFAPGNELHATPEQEAIAKNLLSQGEQGDVEGLIESFTEVAESFDRADDVVGEIRGFLQTLIDEANVKHGLSLTIPEVCQIARLNIDLFGVPPEDREAFLFALEIIETGDRSKLAELDRLMSLTTVDSFHWSWSNQTQPENNQEIVFSALSTTAVTLSGLTSIHCGAIARSFLSATENFH